MDKQITDYKIVTGTHFSIEEEVNNAIKEGWQPLGGISTYIQSHSSSVCILVQAMIK